MHWVILLQGQSTGLLEKLHVRANNKSIKVKLKFQLDIEINTVKL